MDRKSAEIGLEGVGTGYIQTDAAINQVHCGLVESSIAVILIRGITHLVKESLLNLVTVYIVTVIDSLI